MPTRVAVDAMGGDYAPSVVVEGAVRAVRNGAGELELLLFGPAEQIRAELAKHEAPGAGISIHDAPEVISMAESPGAAIKGKPRSSIHLGLSAHKAGHADAFVSAGNTGAVMGAALFLLGRLSAVARPTLVGFYPTTKGASLVLDVGSNVDCKPEHLVQFAKMGAIYAERVMKHASPSVALMNIGEEPGKGNEQAKATFDLLQAESGLNFKGNIEGRDLLHHHADVVVMDGFVGNIVLKLGESVATALPEMIAQAMARLGLDDAAQALVGRVMHEVKRPFNYETHGGAPLLGVSGNVVIGHGGSSAKAIERMILAGAELAQQDVASAIAEEMG